MDNTAQNVHFTGSEAISRGVKKAARWLALVRDDGGSISIETTVSFMVMMLMVLGMMECCMMAYTYGVLEDSAREGVRYACVHGSDSTTCSGPSTGCDSGAAAVIADVKAYARSYAGSLTGINVAVTYPDGVSTGTSRVVVTVSETYQSVFHLPAISQNLSVSSSGRILY